MNLVAEIQSLPKHAWMKSRIPVRDALVAFIPEGKERPSAIDEANDRIGEARWYPESDGLRVAFPYDGQEYDPGVFHIEPKAWDYNECHIDAKHFIPAMVLCYVSKPGYPYNLICNDFYERYVNPFLWKRFLLIIKTMLKKLHKK